MSIEDDLEAAKKLIEHYANKPTPETLAGVMKALQGLANLRPEIMDKLTDNAQLSGPEVALKKEMKEAIAPNASHNPLSEKAITTKAILISSQNTPQAIKAVINNILKLEQKLTHSLESQYENKDWPPKPGSMKGPTPFKK